MKPYAINQAWRQGEDWKHDVAFLDGHVDHRKLEKGRHVTNDYLVKPLPDQATPCVDCQKS